MPSSRASSWPRDQTHIIYVSCWQVNYLPLAPTWEAHKSDQFSSVAQSCPTLCNSMYCSMPVFPVHHQLPQLTQTHVHQVGDAIQPSHPLLFPSPPPTIFTSTRVFSNESVICISGQTIRVSASASVLPMNIQD